MHLQETLIQRQWCITGECLLQLYICNKAKCVFKIEFQAFNFSIWCDRLGSGVCPKAVAKGFRCIYSNQGFWYLDHLDVPWDRLYTAEPLEGINDITKQELVIGGEVCMWGETADPSNVQQTIWPRAAAAAGMLATKKVMYFSFTDTFLDFRLMVENFCFYRTIVESEGSHFLWKYQQYCITSITLLQMPIA